MLGSRKRLDGIVMDAAIDLNSTPLPDRVDGCVLSEELVFIVRSVLRFSFCL